MERVIGYRIVYGDYWESEQPFADNPLFQPGEKVETTIRAIPGPTIYYSSVSNLLRISKSTAAINSLEEVSTIRHQRSDQQLKFNANI
jgi:hypothetical protein